MSAHLLEKETQRASEQKRFAFIELMLVWEGKVNAAHISEHFEIHNKLAAQLLKQYKNLYPENLDYLAAEQCYISTDDMRLQFCEGSLHEYVSTIAHGETMMQLTVPSRHVKPQLVRPILQAIREQRRLKVAYASVREPNFGERIIQPHTIVFDGLRWHVRAYCEKNQGYRDFVLSRFSDEFKSELLDDADYFDLQDELWQTQLTVTFIPDPRLDEARQKIIAMDYDMIQSDKGYRKSMEVRAPLLLYFVQRLGLDQYRAKPESQQIILEPECAKALADYLPS